jgi:hypothetical protein
VSVLLGSDEKAPHETCVQVAGSGRRLSADRRRDALDASSSLHKALLQYANGFLTQITQAALANGRHKI